mmetsp:Transcript_23321/g.69278  ORF Transcript_23321/g.69278 Transcript_23321/m.69278 type:complete len:202 (-) Transcript_23321:648-1253(-)
MAAVQDRHRGHDGLDRRAGAVVGHPQAVRKRGEHAAAGEGLRDQPGRRHPGVRLQRGADQLHGGVGAGSHLFMQPQSQEPRRPRQVRAEWAPRSAVGPPPQPVQLQVLPEYRRLDGARVDRRHRRQDAHPDDPVPQHLSHGRDVVADAPWRVLHHQDGRRDGCVGPVLQAQRADADGSGGGLTADHFCGARLWRGRRSRHG